jgi:MFS family permease
MAVPAFSIHLAMLFASLLLCGIAMALVELGMNITADEIERTEGVGIMNRCHGFWSLGMMVGSVLGVSLANLGLPPHWSVLLVSALVLPIGVLMAHTLPTTHSSRGVPAPVERAIGLFIPGWTLIGTRAGCRDPRRPNDMPHEDLPAWGWRPTGIADRARRPILVKPYLGWRLTVRGSAYGGRCTSGLGEQRY